MSIAIGTQYENYETYTTLEYMLDYLFKEKNFVINILTWKKSYLRKSLMGL
jgi:hypothetical protein